MSNKVSDNQTISSQMNEHYRDLDVSELEKLMSI